jgi:hypothetical protein
VALVLVLVVLMITMANTHVVQVGFFVALMNWT